MYGDEGLGALEVKNARRVRPEDLRALKAFRDDYPESGLFLLYRGRDRLAVDGIRCLPVDDSCPGSTRRPRSTRSVTDPAILPEPAGAATCIGSSKSAGARRVAYRRRELSGPVLDVHVEDLPGSRRQGRRAYELEVDRGLQPAFHQAMGG